MKRRLLCFLMLLTLLCAMTLPASGQTSQLFFVSWNDTLPLTLSGHLMPFAQNGTVLVPHTVFDLSADGITSAVNLERNTLTLFSRNQRLIFDLSAGRVTDENGVSQRAECAVRDSVCFVPLDLCANHFGLSGAVLVGENGYTVVRFTDGQQVYDNARFLQKAELIIAYRLEGYQGSTLPPSIDTPAGDRLPPTVYLTAFGLDHIATAIDTLRDMPMPLAVFFTADEIWQNPSLVRTAYAVGCTVGLTVEEDEISAQDALRRANDALRLVAGRKTVLACLTQEQSEGVEGYCIMDRNLAVSTATAIQLEVESMVLCTESCLTETQLLTLAGAKFRPLRETAPFRVIPAT